MVPLQSSAFLEEHVTTYIPERRQWLYKVLMESGTEYHGAHGKIISRHKLFHYEKLELNVGIILIKL